MASGDLLKRLFTSYQKRDDEGFRAAALQIIAEEQQKNHNVLARDLKRILENGTYGLNNSSVLREFSNLPRDRERDTILLDIRTPEKYFADVVLNGELRGQFSEILDEFRAHDVLRTYGLKFRSKLLFFGPPGCGKTLCAETLASELGLPLLYTRFDAVISSYLGETAANLRKVFDYASRGSWVVFFDEFDAIGKSRDDLGEHGELKRVVNTFLQLLDNFQGNSFFIAATNHESLLDRALWRRFDEILYFPEPTEQEIRLLIDLKLRGFRHPGLDVEPLVPHMRGWSHSDVERVCLEAKRISVLARVDVIDQNSFQQAFERQQHRALLIQRSFGNQDS